MDRPDSRHGRRRQDESRRAPADPPSFATRSSPDGWTRRCVGVSATSGRPGSTISPSTCVTSTASSASPARPESRATSSSPIIGASSTCTSSRVTWCDEACGTASCFPCARISSTSARGPVRERRDELLRDVSAHLPREAAASAEPRRASTSSRGFFARGDAFAGLHPEGTRKKDDDPYTLPTGAARASGKIIHTATRSGDSRVRQRARSTTCLVRSASNFDGTGQPILVVFGRPIDFGELLERPASRAPTSGSPSAPSR